MGGMSRSFLAGVDLGKGMVNHPGKENGMGLEYQAKKDLGFQTKEHFWKACKAEYREEHILCEDWHYSPGIP